MRPYRTTARRPSARPDSSRRRQQIRTAVLAATIGVTLAAPALAQERLCDSSYEDCRTPILNMIRAETVGLDVSFWFMIDTRYSTEIIRRWQAGVPVRILLDVRADENYPNTATIRQSFINAGIPDPSQGDARHQPLEDDPVLGTIQGAFQRGEFRRRLVLANHALYVLRRRSHLLHGRRGGRALVHDEVRRSLDRIPATSPIWRMSPRASGTIRRFRSIRR